MGYGKEIHFFDKPINLGLLPYLVNFAAVDGSGAKGLLDTAALSEFQAALQNKTGDATTTTEEKVSSEGTGAAEGKSGNRLNMQKSVDSDAAKRGRVRRLTAQWAGEAALDRMASLAPESMPMRVHEGAAYEDSYEDNNDEVDYIEQKVVEEEVNEASGESGENKIQDHEPWRNLPTGHLQRRLHEYRTRESNVDSTSSSSGVRGSKASAELPIQQRVSTTTISSDQHMVLAEDDDDSSQAHKLQLKAAAAKQSKKSKKSSSGRSGSESLSRLGKKTHLRRMEDVPPPPPPVPRPPPPFAPPFVNGEATPFYLAERDACRSMAEEMPEPPALIVLLRDPVDRAYSEYQMKV